jgi:hypothetical protein
MATAATVGLVVLMSSPASAAVNDSFTASTDNGCGTSEYVDNGTWSNGQAKDDFIKVHDYCADGHGVRADVWLNGVYLGSKYNGLGQAGPPVYWDPWSNVVAGDFIEMLVCLVDGPNDTTGDRCGYASRTSADG